MIRKILCGAGALGTSLFAATTAFAQEAVATASAAATPSPAATETAAADRSTSKLLAASRKSSPAENTGPAPRNITTRFAASLATSSILALSCSSKSIDRAFRRSSRFSITDTMPRSSVSTRIKSGIVVPPTWGGSCRPYH